MVIRLLESIGIKVIYFLEVTGQVALLLGETFTQLKERVNFSHVIYQMAKLGVDSLPIVLMTVGFTGMVMTLQIAQEFVRYGAQSTIGGIVAIAMGRELAPVLTGVIIAGRVGAAIAAEIGSMKVTEQIDALRVMATNPIGYLVVPRLIACMAMMPVLVVFGDVIGTVGGYLVATVYVGINSFTYLHSIEVFVHAGDVTGGMIKSVVFGAIVAIIGCYKGLRSADGAEGVGRATTGSVVTSMILIFITNYFLSMILYR